MATGTIQVPHMEQLALTKTSNKIDEASFLVFREGNKLYVRGWFHNSSQLSNGEQIYSLPSGVLPYGSFVLAMDRTWTNARLISFQATGEITVNGTLASNYWNIVSSVLVLQT